MDISIGFSDPNGSVKWTEIVQALVLLLGGLFAIWRWGFDEWRTRRREIPVLDGRLEVEIHDAGRKRLAHIRSIWRHKGTIPIYANQKRTCIKFYEIGQGAKSGPVDYNALTPAFLVYPILHWDFCVFEPKTKSEIDGFAYLDAGKIYLVEFEIPFNRTQIFPVERDLIIYSRLAIVDTRKSRLSFSNT